MTRLNITLPDEIAKKIADIHNKSRFIAEALKEKIERERKETIENLLWEGYKATSDEDAKLQANWERTGLEKWNNKISGKRRNLSCMPGSDDWLRNQ